MATPFRFRVASWLAWMAVGLTFASTALGAVDVVGRPLPPWQRGMLDIHQINTGTGDAALFILPDGTTWLLDAGAVDRSGEREPRYDAPQRPDTAQRPGQTIAAYIRRVHPDGAAGGLDYAMLTHFHGDHMGTLLPDAPKSASGVYQLTGITDVGDAVQIRTLLDRDWPDYKYPAPSGGAMMLNYRAFLKWQAEHRGLQVARFEPGRADQIVLRRAPRDFTTFEVRNLAANGRVWTGAGTDTRNRFPEGILPNENNCSLAFRLTYGAFTYFNGGDMAGQLTPASAAWTDMESAVAWVTGPVDVHALNHHGTPDGANAFFLSVLQPRIHILSTYASSQPGPEVMRRLLSERIYPGPRDIFMTNTHWPCRREHMVKLYGEKETAWLLERFGEIAGTQGHAIVRVERGGARYRVVVVDDSTADGKVRSVHGPYESRGTARATR
ncbi:MAG: hypothetical protein EXS37_12420 [Opitutus sp.]|nr:hypothetical protein [Opitutus sp.]